MFDFIVGEFIEVVVSKLKTDNCIMCRSYEHQRSSDSVGGKRQTKVSSAARSMNI